MPGPISVILQSRRRMLDHIVGQIRNYLWIHLAAGIFTVMLIIAGGAAFFFLLFRFLMSQEPFGPPLMEKLMGVVFLAFFSMLIFSNLVITLTTTYISRETEYLMGLPIRFRSLFMIKLVEAIFYSSWAFIVLSVPIFFAYGFAKHAPLTFYPLSFVLGLPFIVVPAAIGAIITMVISAYLPARKARLYSFALVVVALCITAIIVRLMGLRSMVVSASLQDFSQIMGLLNAGSLPLLPNYWLASGLQAASEGRYREMGYWFLCLVSSALMAVQLCLWLVPSLYYRGWALAKETASPTMAVRRHSIFTWVDSLLMRLSPPVRALVGKDMRTFWRDPAQWSQIVILFGLLVIYVANIQGLSKQMGAIENFIRQWRTVLSFFNLGATCFVLSILTTRFVYPMLSLEGKQYWVVGLAPFNKSKLVWEKYILCMAGAALIAVPLTLFSNYVLQARLMLALLSIMAITLLAFGLTSLAVGLSAMFPNFKEDNPARIANGFGGTINIILSLFYIALSLALLLYPAFFLVDLVDQKVHMGYPVAQAATDAFRRLWPFAVAYLALNAVVIILPMRTGVRHWNAQEFNM